MNTQLQKKVGRRWTWRSSDGNTKNEIDYIMTDKLSMVTDVTVINRVNIGSDHMMVMGSITLNMTDKPSMVTDVIVINRVNIGSDHSMAMCSSTLKTRAERRRLLNKNTRTRVDTQIIETKKKKSQLELKKTGSQH